MAHVVKTVMTYPLNGSTRDFNIPFEYLARKFVQVTLVGVDRKTLTLNTDYRFSTKSTITTTQAWGTAQGYQQIEIRRYTSATERLVDFTDGSILRAYDLNVSQIQTMHVAEEARDLTADTIGVNNEGHLDARGRRIVNLALAVEDTDAITFGQVKTMNQNAWDARNQAEQFKDQAAASAAAALASQNQTAAYQTAAYNNSQEALQYRNEAEQFKNQTVADRNAAGVSANGAALSQAAAAQSEANALAQANRATSEADRAKIEADKLGNWNALAGTVSGISEVNVRWKGNHRFGGDGMELALTRSSDATSSYIGGLNASGALDWYAGKGGASEDIVFTKTTGGTLKLNSSQTQLLHGASKVTMVPTGIDYSSNNHAFNGEVRFNGVSANNTNTIHLSGRERNELQLQTKTGVAGTQVNGMLGTWYDCWWNFGARRGNSTDLQKVVLHVYNTGTDEAEYSFSYNGVFSVNRGFAIARDGNIVGPAWSNLDLKSYLDVNYQSKGAHALTRGWSIVWSGSFIPGQVIALTQDIRFRQVWFLINGRFVPYIFGDDGTYHAQGWGSGWMHINLAKGGTELGYYQGDQSPVTAIYVMA